MAARVCPEMRQPDRVRGDLILRSLVGREAQRHTHPHEDRLGHPLKDCVGQLVGEHLEREHVACAYVDDATLVEAIILQLLAQIGLIPLTFVMKDEVASH